jgi:hypothetical protein
MRSVIQVQLSAALPATLVDELLEAHAEAKRNFYLGGLRLSEVEGGRFCEAAFRLLEWITTNTFTPLGAQLRTDPLIDTLEQLPKAAHKESVRIHIPRALRLVYDIRNKRDAAHLADGIDPNVQDASLVCTVIDWVLAEFIRLYHNVSANDAQAIVNDLVTRSVPVIQEFKGFLKLLNPSLGATEHCLLLLYQCGDKGATFTELQQWVRSKMRANLGRTLNVIVDGKDFAHFDGTRYFITRLGQQTVEIKRLLNPDAVQP